MKILRQHGILAATALIALSLACNLSVEPAPTQPTGPPTAFPESGSADGPEFHVASEGDDSNDGSASAPWASLQHAVDTVPQGGTILVHPGSYAGMRIERSGSSEAWNTIKAAEAGTVVIDRPGSENEHDSIIEIETWEDDGPVAYWRIEGLEVTGAPSWGIDLRGYEEAHAHHFVLSNNRVHNNGIESGRSGIFTAFVDDIVIESNESFDNGEHGIYLSNSGDRYRVVDNELHGNLFCGLHMNGDASQGGDGIISDGLVQANIIHDNGAEGCSGINMDSVTDSTISNNLLYDNHSGGISLFQENGAVCSQRNRVLHNTVLMPTDGRWALNLSDTDCTHNQIFNNILLTQHEWRGSILLPRSGIVGFESSHNLVMDRFSADDDQSVISLEEWQGQGFGQNSRLATPGEVFLDAVARDFHLNPDGPAVDAGLSLPDVIVDLEGNERPLGQAPDIGAFELGASASEPASSPTAQPVGAGGTITFTSDDRVFRIPAQQGAEPQDVSAQLDELSSGSFDELVNISPDGEWLLVETDRFDQACLDLGSCLVLLPADLNSFEVLRAQGEPIDWEGLAAVGSGAQVIVYAGGGGPHELDLWSIQRDGDGWTDPTLLTDSSAYTWNHQPAIYPDGELVVFDCGDEPYGAEGTAICQVRTDGTDFRALITPADSPAGFPNQGALHHPDYGPDGSVVFEADWDGEQIWRLPPGTNSPELITGEFGNDNSPCVLPNGNIASLW
ncbi:MAG: NosD domain-containing protein, partial [Anaerolineales bacterium]